MKRTFLKPVINLAETGKRIREIRVEQGFSVRDIQVIFGFDYPQAVYAWEQGKSVPTVDNLLVLSQVFGVELNQLLVTDQIEISVEADQLKKSA